jgi:anti-sigma-K factor RskA
VVVAQVICGVAKDLTKTEFCGTEGYSQMTGNVVWSDELQEGYMTLTNLPANDPASKQYQLWIVDPDRDEKPVDGGVFDIPAHATTAVIPIRNPLAVTDPKAFVITLEQPGGVVVSKQEIVVALAKTS